jgi:hypothetical protein
MSRKNYDVTLRMQTPLFMTATRTFQSVSIKTRICLDFGVHSLAKSKEWRTDDTQSASFYSFIHSSMAVQPYVGPDLFFSFVIFFTQAVRLLGRVISPSQGRCLHTGQHKHIINAHRYPCFEWDSKPRSQLSSEQDNSRLRPRGHCDQKIIIILGENIREQSFH